MVKNHRRVAFEVVFLSTRTNRLDRHSNTLALTRIYWKRGMELSDNQETQKKLVINFLLLGTDKILS